MIEPDTLTPVGEAGPALPDSVRRHLGGLLRLAYDEAPPEVPERFTELLARLGQAMGRAGGLAAGDEATFRTGLLASVPALRRFALSLAREPAAADDLVQDALLRAWRGRGGFEPGTNLEAWLFTILRNVFYSRHRRQTREIPDSDGDYAGRLATAPEQGGHLDLQDVRAALDRLAPVMREALVLVGIENLSYEEAAAVMECQIGTAKSRVWRARAQLARMLGYGGADIGSDGLTLSALGTVTESST
jgi:RNA polymerase sigma-70 factor (ECF subfamily)